MTGYTKCRTFTIFDKGDNFSDFQFSFLYNKSLLKMDVFKKGKNLLPRGAHSFLLELTPFLEGSKTILTELSPLKVYQFPLRG